MWPWGHLAVGYLLYALACRWRGSRPTERGAVVLAVGTQFPDLVDKPLAWTVQLLPNGRSLAHSLVIASLLWFVLAAIATRRGRIATVGTFVLGYASHLFADALHPAVTGNVDELAFLAWPLLPPVIYSGPQSFLGHFLSLEPTPFVLGEACVVIVTAGLWLRDGAPGTRVIYHALRQ